MIIVVGGLYSGCKGKTFKDIVKQNVPYFDNAVIYKNVEKELFDNYIQFNASSGYGKRHKRVTAILVHKKLLE